METQTKTRKDPRRGGARAEHVDGDEKIRLMIGGRTVTLTGLIIGMGTGIDAFDRDDIIINAEEADRIRRTEVGNIAIVAGFTLRRLERRR